MFVARSMSAVNPPPRMAVIRRSDMTLLDEVDLLFPRPHGIVVHPKGDVVYVASLGTNQIATVGVDEGEVRLLDVPGMPARASCSSRSRRTGSCLPPPRSSPIRC